MGVQDRKADLKDDTTGKAWLLGWDQPSTFTAASIPRSSGSQKSRVLPDIKKPVLPRPRAKVIMLDPEQDADPLDGYNGESPSSSRSSSPTPSYLEEVAGDPSLALESTQKKTVKRPVYIAQLVALLKEREKPEHLEMGLKWGEGLVRAKRSFGRELGKLWKTSNLMFRLMSNIIDESAVAVATMVISLNDPFHLDGFNEKRQGLLTALVACSPKNVAPCAPPSDSECALLNDK